MFRRLDVWLGTRLNKPTGPQAPTPQRPIGANARTGVGAYRIRPPNIPQGMNDHTPGTCIRPVPGRLVGRMQYAPTRVTDAPSPRKVSKRAAERFRGLGKLKNAPLNVSEASEGSKHAAEGFRRLGASTDAGEAGRVPGLTSLPRQRLSADTPRAVFIHRIKNYHS